MYSIESLAISSDFCHIQAGFVDFKLIVVQHRVWDTFKVMHIIWQGLKEIYVLYLFKIKG